ncbi:hypothetical protein COCNU_03G001660 [Cocos nucifera]|uniref:C2H2-type domain-containing protein n=1 Tax=Cocos nucifera TaxID=13894 RepID=A0A8K0MXS3_COCNU|nr:hypothetical protein COCNU_03G001660 [Cocos nucifera]
MDKHMQHLELLPNQSSPIEASFPIETILMSPKKQSTSPNITLMEASILAPLEEPSDHISTANYGPTSQNPFDFLATGNQLAFIPNSSLSSTSLVNHPTTISTTTAQVEIGSLNLSMMDNQPLPQFPNTSFLGISSKNFDQLAYSCPSQQVPEENLCHVVSGSPPKQYLQEHNNLYHVVDGFLPQKQPPKANLHLTGGYLSQNPHPQQIPSMDYTNLKDRVPCIDQQTFFSFHGPNPTYLNPAWDYVDTNWEGINAYLLGKVRPSPDITHIYKCSICGIESPNAQAYGGHLSSHRKNKKKEKLAANKHELEKVDLKPPTNTGKAIIWPSSRKSTLIKEHEDEKNDVKNKKLECESENSVSSLFI